MDNTSRAESNKRRVIRVKDNLLHPALRLFRLVTETGDACTVRTYDASSLGLGLILPVDAPAIREGDALVVWSHDGEFKLKGKVVFLAGGEVRRIGLQFHGEDNALFLQKLLQKPPREH